MTPVTRASGRDIETWMTCAVDRLHHAINEEDFDYGLHCGRYLAVCGHLVLPCALVSPPGRRCPLCGSKASQPNPGPVNPSPSRSLRTVTAWLRR